MDYQEALKRGIEAKNYERFAEAVEWFSKAIALDWKQPQGYFYRANIYNHSLQEYSKALEDYDRAIALKQDDEGYYYNRALLFLNLGDVERALEDYDAALHINPDYALAIWDKALIEADLEEFESAMQGLRQSAGAVPLFRRHHLQRQRQPLLQNGAVGKSPGMLQQILRAGPLLHLCL